MSGGLFRPFGGGVEQLSEPCDRSGMGCSDDTKSSTMRLIPTKLPNQCLNAAVR